MISILLRNAASSTTLSNSNEKRRRRHIFHGIAALGAASAASLPLLSGKGKASLAKRSRRAYRANHRRRKFLNPFMADAIIGAIGEICQLAILYPLDTIKVRCQAQGASPRMVWAGVKSQGFNMKNLSSLFAGCLPSAACAAVIGACYLASFSMARRLLERPQPAAKSIFAFFEPSQPSQNSDSELRSSQETQASSASEGDSTEEVVVTALNDTAAAVIASLLTSILEAPVELFRHRLQAGILKGSMLRNMTSAFGLEGMRSLYGSFTPFLIKGIPYDVAELITYSQLTKYQLQLPGFPQLTPAFRDCLIGALAGAAAVVLSMPADCVKTRMDLAAVRPPTGLLASSGAFLRTGRLICAESGLQGFFRGIKPRLLENVPSTMFYWVVVATLRRSLEPYIKNEDSES